MLKRATAAQLDALEEDTLNFRLLHLQMWFIYWVVTAVVSLVEDFTFVKAVPMYLIWRLILSAWLMFPITNFGLLRLLQVLTYNEMQTAWQLFSNEGCGLVYFQYLVPLFRRQTESMGNTWSAFWSHVSKQSVRDYMPNDLGAASFAHAKTAGETPPASAEATKPDSLLHNLNGLGGLVGAIFPTKELSPDQKDSSLRASGSASLLSDRDFAEYAVVDKPGNKESSPGVKQRPAIAPVVGKESASSSSGSRFKIW
ncbi:hypothetical protein PUMCH_003690 [Australozyma saopauloensis]|uniref:Protein YOP1 n=1 Tax=Australozyma saopauloensis TaxID=291208 RepID=A0AAX4HCN3_9ASCO|nr:hypothetical protein PUMCH_003690 [[Candida] saopauloensis]